MFPAILKKVLGKLSVSYKKSEDWVVLCSMLYSATFYGQDIASTYKICTWYTLKSVLRDYSRDKKKCGLLRQVIS